LQARSASNQSSADVSGPSIMRNSIAHGWGIANRTTLLQICAALIAAAICAPFGMQYAVAALVGGVIIALGSWLFALRLYGLGITSARKVLRSAWLAQMVKWLWLCTALYVAIAVVQLSFPGLIVGIMAAQLAFWIALIAIR
jgi:F0F1-type ATP synthase assembly protein I